MANSKFKYPPLKTVADLIDQMTTPLPKVIQAIQNINSEIMILGVGGKMGPTLAELAVRAGGKIIGVDIFPQPEIKNHLDRIGVRTIACDLFDEQQLAALPDIDHIVFMAGTKFGSTANQPFTWAMNTLLPSRVVQRFPHARIIYLSSGNVYKFVPVHGMGATENDALEPIGEYAMSRLGGERLVQFITQKNRTACCIVRLFYATELRYGIIHDLAQKIKAGATIDLSMGYFNQIWQGDANAYILQCFPLCDTPAQVVNLTGPDILSVQAVAQRLGDLMGIAPKFAGTANDTALLGDASLAIKRLGPPAVTSDQIIEWVAWWVMHGGESLGKPTKFERRDGKF